MSKNKKIISLSIDPDLHEALVELKKKRGESVSSMVTGLVDRFVGVLDNMDGDDEVVPIVLKVPEEANDEAAKEEWLLRKEATLVSFSEALCNKEVVPIVLQIPKELCNNPESLKSWLKSRTDAIAGRLAV